MWLFHFVFPLTRYREAGAEVIDVLKQFSDAVERASIDEAYIDLTETVHKYLQEKPEKEIMLEDLKNSFVCGWDSNNASDLDKDGKLIYKIPFLNPYF